MLRFTTLPASLLDRVSFYSKLTMQKKHEGIHEQYLYSFDFLLVLMDTGHSVVRTAVFLFTFSFGDSSVLHIIIDMMAVIFLSINTCS